MLGGFDGGYDDASGAGSVACSAGCSGGAAAKRVRDLEQLGQDVKRLKTEECVSSAEWLTPAATPAYAGVAESVSSPYSETEEYMFRGYYEDELIESNRACTPYEMTPASANASNHDNEAAWSGTAPVYEDSYDIEM